MLVAAHYIKLGYQVLWPSVDRSSYDLVIDTGEELLRVQVKKAFWNTHASMANDYLQCRIREYTAEAFEILVAVCPDGRLVQIPWPEFSEHSCIMLEKRGPTIRDCPEHRRAEEWRLN